MVVQDSKAFWMGEQDWFLLQVFNAGVSSSSGGAAFVLRWASSRGERRGVVAWATLGAGATLGGVRRGGVLVGNGENVAGGRGLGTWQGLRGGTMGGLAGGGRGGAAIAVVRLLATVVVSRVAFRGMRGGGDLLDGVSLIWGMLCLRMLPRRSRWSRAVVLRCWGMRPLISSESLCAAATTRSEGVTVGWVRYLCLRKMVAETRVERVLCIHMVQAR